MVVAVMEVVAAERRWGTKVWAPPASCPFPPFFHV